MAEPAGRPDLSVTAAPGAPAGSGAGGGTGGLGGWRLVATTAPLAPAAQLTLPSPCARGEQLSPLVNLLVNRVPILLDTDPRVSSSHYSWKIGWQNLGLPTGLMSFITGNGVKDRPRRRAHDGRYFLVAAPLPHRPPSMSVSLSRTRET